MDLNYLAIGIVGIYFCIFLKWLFKNYVGPTFFGSPVKIREMGDWAVITGATDGIGKAYAKMLAERGLNLVLISRSMAKLQDTSKEIRNTFDIKIRIIEADFSKQNHIFDKISRNLQDISVGVLVNNVGISNPYPEYFTRLGQKFPTLMEDTLSVNIKSMINMCLLILPSMEQNGKGIIINISSMTGIIPSPLLTVYGASKAFILKFSDDLKTEYSSRGIIVQVLTPGFVATKLAKLNKTNLFVPSPDQYVASALRTLGFLDRTAGYFPHIMFEFAVTALEKVLGKKIIRNIIFSKLLTTRKFALKKLNAVE